MPVCNPLRNVWFQNINRYCRDVPEMSRMNFLQVCVAVSLTSSEGSDLEQRLQTNADSRAINPSIVKMHLQSTGF